MKNISKYISAALLTVALGCSFTACDDWTEPESIDLDYGTIDKADPESYLNYLANLREYRNKEHKLVYVWFDNKAEAFGTQSERISALPDSVDVIVINNPANVTNQFLQEMYDARVNKGQQFSYCISFNDIRADWTLTCEDLAAKRLEWEAQNPGTPVPVELEDPDFGKFMSEAFSHQLKYFNTVGFDAIMVAFDGKRTIHLTPSELADYNAQANLFLGIVNDWHQRNPNVLIDFYGKAQNVTDQAILGIFNQVFPSESDAATDINAFTQIYNLLDGIVAPAKIGMVASMRAIDTNADPKTGFFSNGTLAVNGLATWTAAHNVGAAGIKNVQTDYHITNGQYSTIRAFIQKINPAAK